MSFQTFIADPKVYLKIHQMTMSGDGNSLWANGATAMTRNAPVVNGSGGNSIQFTHNTNVTMNQTYSHGATSAAAVVKGQLGIANKREVLYVAAPGGATPNLRILPWSGSDVTFMQIDGNANLAMTGPLTGCTVAVVHFNGNIWFFHANVSGAGGVNPANRATKRQMIQNAGALVGISAATNYSYCEYGDGFQYQGQAFVWGRARTGSWKFYVHEARPASGLIFKTRKTLDDKWAEI